VVVRLILSLLSAYVAIAMLEGLRQIGDFY
jgi:hypothetical protein